MTDSSVPPSVPPPVVRLRTALQRSEREELQEREIVRLNRALEGERALVEMLRSQLVTQRDPGDEATEPGIGIVPEKRPAAAPPAPEPHRGRWSARHTMLVGGLALSVASAIAATRYPALLTPIRWVGDHLGELAQLLEQL
jgi:hypothetical protein